MEKLKLILNEISNLERSLIIGLEKAQIQDNALKEDLFQARLETLKDVVDIIKSFSINS